MAAVAVSGRLRTLGRGASGAVVSLAWDAASGELVAVKSAGASGAAALRREHAVLAGLRSPHVVRCFGGGEAAEAAEEGSSYQLFLEYAPGGSLADEVARSGGSLGERAVRAFAADVLRGLAALSGSGSGSARRPIVGATPAFMAPEVARGEDQGPPADVWALGCTVVEMATGRAPFGGMGGAGGALAAVHRIAYTDAVPEVPAWLSPEAGDFLARCFARDAADRWTAARLLEHPFVALARHDDKAPRPSPKSALDAAFWESETECEDEADDASGSASERIESLACSAGALPDWDGEGGWIDVLGEHCGAPGKASSVLVAVPGGEMDVGGGGLPSDDGLEAEDVPFGGGGVPVPVPAADASAGRHEKHYGSGTVE
ncbi:Mitogen-activated protein kinase kinase kinase A [Zea mays]|uniref:Mitogen-activated protein kinase kinase kinase A n=1 Tax=Zea mays TaxID=4577 RepID=A0A3L6DU29_MAIZE|nr:Mitogen-activated protein kinase kinase kinase A [Zea mays]